MLTFSTTVPDDFASQTVGLVGNFDGDDTNDFILPNGTVLTENQTRTERQIFYNFGVNCEYILPLRNHLRPFVKALCAREKSN